MADQTESNPSLDSKKTENAATLAWAQRWLSAPRLEPYLTACDDDMLYGSSEQTSVERYVQEHPAPANVKL